jgi:hypothetical protein
MEGKMKKTIFTMFIFITMFFICACSDTSYTEKRWVYSDLVSINVNEDIDESLLQMYLEHNEATSVSELETILLNKAKEEEQFNDFYLFFEDKYAHFYHEILDIETTYFHKEIDGEVVLALTELQFEDPNEVNLDPVICPRVVVSKDGKELTFTYYYIYYFVTIKCAIEK